MIHLVFQDTYRGEELPMSRVQQTVYALRPPQVTRLNWDLNSHSLFLSLIIIISLKSVENDHQWHHLLRNTPRTALT